MTCQATEVVSYCSMVPGAGKSWKPLAWNGVCLRVPPNWEVSSLAPRHLQVDDGEGPVLELKWRRLEGRFSHEVHLKRLARFSGPVARLTFEEKPLAEEWRQALHGFDVRGFAWQTSDIGGEGAIIFCPRCHTATLIQFYQRPGRDHMPLAVEILRSFRDHSENGLISWTLFGISAQIPERFQLVGRHFYPGHYELRFADRREELRLSRWSPADVLLREDDLRSWFTKVFKRVQPENLSSVRPLEFRGNPALEWRSRPAVGPAKRLWARVTGRKSHLWIRIWHLTNQNQIIGVEASSLQPIDEAFFQEICDNYEVV